MTNGRVPILSLAHSMMKDTMCRGFFMFRVRTQLGLTDAYLASCQKRYFHRSITIAILDSGIYPHPDLKDNILAFADFSGSLTKGKTIIRKREAYDEYGHGTHVCGILCGKGILSGGRYKGILPEAKLVVGKVLDQAGNGSAEDMLSGMEWVLRRKEKDDIRLLNISVGISALKDQNKLKQLTKMVEKISKSGILVVCAAGNLGPMAGSLSALGEREEVISVGCHDGAYYQRDPRRCDLYCGRGRERAIPRKPDVVAPGTCITSCSANYGKGNGKNSPYEVRSGTSMSTPIVTGCLGRLLQMEETLTPKELHHILTTTAKDLGEPWNKQGWGMIQPRRMEDVIRKRMDF